MIKALFAYTESIDDTEMAVQEILTQLDIKNNLKKNTVAIMSCHYEFVNSGVVEAVCNSLPFDVTGTTTPAQAIPDAKGTFMLSLTVLTSDDVSFKTIVTESLLQEPTKVIQTTYAKNVTEPPALIFSYAGFLIQNSGDEYVNAVTEVSGGIPCFGTLAVDNTSDFIYSFMIYNGEVYRDRMCMVLFYGNVNPRFKIANISDNKIISKPALITKSAGHILKELNGKPVAKYFEELGLTKASEHSYAMTSLPFMIDYCDGTPKVSKVFVAMTEDKNALCAGVMPEGSTLYIGVFDKDDVLLTTGNAVNELLNEVDDISCIFMYSCIARNMTLGADYFGEIDLINNKLRNTPFMIAYSGGEMCPTQVSDKHAINRFHNNAFVLCAL